MNQKKKKMYFQSVIRQVKNSTDLALLNEQISGKSVAGFINFVP